MRAFSCPDCDQFVVFHNSACLRCGAPLAFDPVSMTMVVPTHHEAQCANVDLAACNWLAEDSEDGRCRSCLLTRTRPADDDPDALRAFARTEMQKRRLVFQLLELGLPVWPHDEDSNTGVAFDLLSSRHGSVMTGHDSGVITLDLAESDDVHRARVRAEMGEAYRTVLGHLRHEIGHWYWDVMVGGTPGESERFRARFGDERLDYSDALERHYRDGPPTGWADEYVSSYATMHPWEDWAETFAHYLHLRDAMQTAASFGLRSAGQSAAPDVERLAADPADLDRHGGFGELVDGWVALSYALNAMSRSLGNGDLYPFVLTPAVIDKLGHVHELVERTAVTPDAD